MSEAGSHYVHGASPEEQRRLSHLNRLLNAGSVAEMALAGGERVLDVGSGLGQLSRAIAREAGPRGRVIGIERSVEQIAEAQRQAADAGEERLVEFRAGDVNAFPLRDDEWGSFDVVHGRFILEHVPRPLAIVRAMVRAARPGGRIVLEDDDHDILRVWPEPDGLRPVWDAYIRSYRMAGNDPDIGRKLPVLLHAAGAEPKRATWLFFGACAGSPDFPGYVDNLAVVIEGARDSMLAEGGVDAATIDRALASVRSLIELPDAALWYARCWAEGCVQA